MKDSLICRAQRLLLLAFLPALAFAAPALASSHREAPGIAKDPVADNTDVYFFRDPVDPTRLVLISNWIPLEEPAGGPNFFHFGENIRYEFNVDSNGDGLEDIVYRFEFTRHVRNVFTWLQNTGPVSSPTDSNQNVYYTYSVSKCLGPSPNQSACTVLGNLLLEAPNNPGPKSFPNGYATGSGIATTVYPVDDETIVFAGPRAEGFYVDLGMIFDLVNFRPGTLPGNHGGGVNSTAGYNVHSIALSLPIRKLTKNGTAPTDPADPNAIVSMWSTTWRQQSTSLSTNGAPPSSSNGRRVYDDVVDIALRVVAGVLVPAFNIAPNNLLGDGVDGPDVPYIAGFPFLAPPYSGYDRAHANVSVMPQGGRFRTSVTWSTPGKSGAGTSTMVATNTTGFWFFSPDNVDLTVKVLDGRAINGKFWVFYGSLTNVQFTLTVTDTTTGAQKTYTNPQGQNTSGADLLAF